MATTIVDVARQAGVSIATVSRVIHESPLVNAQTRERVEQAMADLKYAPNAVARGLVTRRTQAIGLVITSLADPFVPPIVQGVEESALNHGYSVLLCTSNNDPERELAVVRLLNERRVDAVIVASSRVGGLYLSRREHSIPLVLINNEQSGAYTYSVSTDNVGGGYAAGLYLLRLGHRRIGYIHGPLEKQSTHDRYMGFCRALLENGLAPDPALTATADGQAPGGQQAMLALLAQRERPTAVFCFNDLTALGALRAARLAGLRAPDDVSVLGYDDIALAAFAEPPLSTVAQQTYELGKQALLLALGLLNGQDVASMTLPAALVERGSCGPPAGAS